MDIKDVKKNLNRKVTYTDGYGDKSEYMLTACVLKKNKKTDKYYYLVELQDLKINSIMTVGLNDID